MEGVVIARCSSRQQSRENFFRLPETCPLAPLVLGALRSEALASRKGKNVAPIPFVSARHFQVGRRNGVRPLWVVIHTAETPETLTTAESLAAWAAQGMAPGRQVSWHYAVDSDSIVQSVREENTAWAAGPGNSRGIHIELAGRARQTAAEWEDDYSKTMLLRAAELVAGICARWQIPIRHPLNSGVLRLEAGIIGHDQLSWASTQARREVKRAEPWFYGGKWITTTHTDPGSAFPWEWFIACVESFHGSNVG